MPRTSSSRSRIIGHGETWTLRRHGRRRELAVMFRKGPAPEKDIGWVSSRQSRHATNLGHATNFAFVVGFPCQISPEDAQDLIEVLELIPGIFKVRYSEPSSFVCCFADEPSGLNEASEERKTNSAKTRKTELRACVQAALSTFLDNQIAPNDRQDWKPSIYGLA